MRTLIPFCSTLFMLYSICDNLPAQQNEKVLNDFIYAGVNLSAFIDKKEDIVLNKYLLDTLYSFPSPETYPVGLTWDGQYLWNCDEDSRMIYKLTSAGNIVSSFPAPDPMGVGDLECDGNYLWFGCERSAILYKIDTTTGVPIEQFYLPSYGESDPNGWGLAWDGQFLWHSEYGDSARIYKLDPQNGQVISSFIPPKKFVLGITWVDGYLFGINIEHVSSSGIIYKFEPSSGVVLDSAFWEIPYPLGLDWDGNYFWNVSSKIDYGGNARIYKVSSPITSNDDGLAIKLNNFILTQNYPNPFNPRTKIKYSIPNVETRHASSLQMVTLKVYDVLGNEIETLVDEEKSAGTYELTWYAINRPSGIYFYQLKAGEYEITKKMILLK